MAVAVSCVVPPIFTVGWAGAIASEVNVCAWPAAAWKTPASRPTEAGEGSGEDRIAPADEGKLCFHESRPRHKKRIHVTGNTLDTPVAALIGRSARLSIDLLALFG